MIPLIDIEEDTKRNVVEKKGEVAIAEVVVRPKREGSDQSPYRDEDHILLHHCHQHRLHRGWRGKDVEKESIPKGENIIVVILVASSNHQKVIQMKQMWKSHHHYMTKV